MGVGNILCWLYRRLENINNIIASNSQQHKNHNECTTMFKDETNENLEERYFTSFRQLKILEGHLSIVYYQT